ncbi:DUF1259 domain-containing protein [Hymenobacter latericus]|uniref:DUF1259 domain-containing protein n=1 Tax=Hymenobacter sp. YIM 151858-1 TaxID=2987688 RepID=UPI002227AB49|nr:DUF1259 domain-containing protein [Hymenobacter sp. YIM 151858-1]UYZ60841.1 DUF1259 domain-containing protein [Hymenobacter sp. YIM 151858-1]
MNHRISRREALRNTALLGAAPWLSLGAANAAPAVLKAPTPPLTAAEIASIEAALGKKGTYVEAQATHCTALPRNDLQVRIKGEPVPIAFGFGGWVAIKHTLDGKSAMLMSDTVLLQEEVNPLMSAALAQGLEVGAVHNHFFYEEPRIFYMHIHGMGSPAELAAKFAAALKNSKLLPANQPPSATPAASQAGNNATPAAGAAPTGKELFDLAALDKVVGYQGAVNGPTYKYTVGRADLQVVMMNTEMTAAIGLNSWAAFAGRQADAHVAGDIAMLEHEVNPVIKTLRAHNLEVVAVHNHMLFDQPRMVFLHYYGRGPAPQLAAGFRAALDQLGKRPPHDGPAKRGMKH